MDRYKLPPGPRRRFLIGNFPLGSRDPLGLFTQWTRTYGDISYYRAFTTPVYFLNHPDFISSVLITNYHDFRKGRGLEMNRRLFGNGLLTSEGEFWQRQRRLCQPAFHAERVRSYGRRMVEYAERMMEGWQAGERRNLHVEMRKVTLEIAVRTLFGVAIPDLAARVGPASNPIVEFNERGRILIPLVRYLPTPLNLRYRRAVGRLERLVETIVREHGPADGEEDLLSRLLEARDEEGRGMSARQLRDEMITLLLAGHETTALALSWTFYLLGKHPDVEEKLLAEIRTVLGEKPAEAEDLPQLVFAGQVIRESLRLYPPAYAIARVALRDTEIGGYRVPRGASVVMSQWVMHRDPRFFDDPEGFHPERWSEEFAKRLPRFAYFPFGGGPRTCIGASFAMVEAVLLLVTILARFHFSLVPGSTVTPITSVTLRPKEGIWVVLSRQQSPRPEKHDGG